MPFRNKMLKTILNSRTVIISVQNYDTILWSWKQFQPRGDLIRILFHTKRTRKLTLNFNNYMYVPFEKLSSMRRRKHALRLDFYELEICLMPPSNIFDHFGPFLRCCARNLKVKPMTIWISHICAVNLRLFCGKWENSARFFENVV